MLLAEFAIFVAHLDMRPTRCRVRGAWLILAARSVNASSLRRWTWWLRVAGVLVVTAATMILMFETRAFPLLFVLFPLLI